MKRLCRNNSQSTSFSIAKREINRRVYRMYSSYLYDYEFNVNIINLIYLFVTKREIFINQEKDYIKFMLFEDTLVSYWIDM